MTMIVLHTTKAAAEILGLSPRTLERWRISGGGPRYTQVSSRAIRYAESDLQDWLESRKRANTYESGAA